MSAVDDPVMALGNRRDNAELMVDCDLLGYLVEPILDATYGLGAFWRCPRARAVTAVDLDPRRGVLVADFRSLPFAGKSFTTVVFDPPYKLNGTGGSHPSDDRYGVATAGVSWQDKHKLIRDGMTDCHRVLRPGGHLLVKCQDQVCSGSVRWQTREFADHAETLGMRLVDMLHVVGHRRQPEGRRQVHARRDYSTLLVLKVPAR